MVKKVMVWATFALSAFALVFAEILVWAVIGWRVGDMLSGAAQHWPAGAGPLLGLCTIVC